jgi:hypothetical protein
MPLSSIFPEAVLGHPKGAERKSSQPAPKAHKPKARPPNSLHDKVPLYGKLPKYSGPYKVGLLDIEVPAINPGRFPTSRETTHTLSPSRRFCSPSTTQRT